MSDEDLPPTHQPWGAEPGPDPSSQPPFPSSAGPPSPPPPTQPYAQQGAPYPPPPNPYPQPGSFDQYAAPNRYGASPYGGYPGGQAALAPEHPSANTGLVLGIVALVGIFTCAGVTLVLSPFAWVISRRALRDIDASPGRYSGREKVNAARIMGMIGTALLALAMLALIAIVGLAVAITPSGGNIGPNPPQVHHRGVSS
jgi:hypothetical protein